MKNLLVIPSYNMNEKCFENVCYNSELLNELETIIIDNNSTDKTYLEKLRNQGIKVISSKFNGAYETGALLQCYEDFDAENYFLLQDSIKILNSKPFFEYCNSESEYVLCLKLFFPAIHGMNETHKNLFNKKFSKLRYLILREPGIQYNSFLCKKNHLKKMVDSKLLNYENIPTNKRESEVWERAFSLALHHLNIDCKSLEILCDRLWEVTGNYNFNSRQLQGFNNVFEKTLMSRE